MPILLQLSLLVAVIAASTLAWTWAVEMTADAYFWRNSPWPHVLPVVDGISEPIGVDAKYAARLPIDPYVIVGPLMASMYIVGVLFGSGKCPSPNYQSIRVRNNMSRTLCILHDAAEATMTRQQRTGAYAAMMKYKFRGHFPIGQFRLYLSGA